MDRSSKEAVLADKKALLLKEKCKRDFVFWLKNYVQTYDEHQEVSSIRPFTVYPYTEQIAAEFTREPIVHVVKSRQMMLSWLAMAFLLHEAQFGAFRLELVFSKKEEDAHNLVERAKFMYTSQPAWLKESCPLDRKMKDMPYGAIYFANGSKVKGLAQGRDQVRGHVPTTAFLDEAAFQDKLQETYEACVPCAKRIITVSTANEGFFRRLVEL